MTFKLDIEATLKKLLAQEDTDNDKKITVEDQGPKSFTITSEDGLQHTLDGTYHLSNLLQELILAKEKGDTVASISLDHLEEPPVKRISRMIREYYWNGLTRTMDASGIESLLKDSKNETLDEIAVLIVYVPYHDEQAYSYY